MRLRGIRHLTVIDSIPERLENVKRIAHADRTINFAETPVKEILKNERLDLVVDAVGSRNILMEGSYMLVPGGKLCSLGVLKKAEKTAMNSEDALTIPIERTCDREYLGQFLLKQPDAHTFEVGLDLREKNRSRGIGTEVMRLLLTKLREQNTEDMVTARAYSDNVRSIRLIQKVGGVKLRGEPSEYEAAKAIMHQISEETDIEMPEGDADISNRHILVYRLPC